VATTYEAIRSRFEQVRDYVVSDLDRVIEQTDGGNYIAAALITCACDALSNLKHGRENHGYLFFKELLPNEWRPVAKSLYEAIRHGLVHTYDTRLICIGPRELEVIISWGQKPHLRLSENGKQVYINIRQLSQDFKAALKRFESDLQEQATLRDTFARSIHRWRKQLIAKSEVEKWEQLLRIGK
jgi:hypothetical protein